MCKGVTISASSRCSDSFRSSSDEFKLVSVPSKDGSSCSSSESCAVRQRLRCPAGAMSPLRPSGAQRNASLPFQAEEVVSMLRIAEGEGSAAVERTEARSEQSWEKV